MTAPTLFDADGIAAQPRVRNTDPDTSRLARDRVRHGNAELVKAIRAYVTLYGPSSAWEIADGVAGVRWQYDTVRSACARSGLEKLERWGESPGGRSCCLYRLAVESVDVHGETL